MQSQTSQSERVIGTILAIVLVLFASVAAPKLPKSVVKHLENPLIRLIIFISIGYLATRDLITAIIAVIAVLVSYQTLSVHKLTDNMIKKTNDVINENIPVSPDENNKSRQQMNENEIMFQNQVNNLTPTNYEEIKQIVNNYLMNNIKPGTYLDSHTIIINIINENPTLNAIIVNKAIIDLLNSPNPSLQMVNNIDNCQMVNNDNSQMVNNEVNLLLENKPVEKKVTFSDVVNVMEIGDNTVNEMVQKNVEVKRNKKLLQGVDNINLEQNFDLLNYNLLEGTSNLLTDSCSNKHKINFNCANIPKLSNELTGYSNDFEINSSV
jgi:hypothetical protein